MDQSKILLLAVVGVGAYLLLSQRAQAQAQAQQYRVPGVNATGAPRYPTATTVQGATEAAAYQNLGSLIGGIYRKIGSAGSSTPAARPILPDDSIAANPAGNIDPYDFETATWGFGD